MVYRFYHNAHRSLRLCRRYKAANRLNGPCQDQRIARIIHISTARRCCGLSDKLNVSLETSKRRTRAYAADILISIIACDDLVLALMQSKRLNRSAVCWQDKGAAGCKVEVTLNCRIGTPHNQLLCTVFFRPVRDTESDVPRRIRGPRGKSAAAITGRTGEKRPPKWNALCVNNGGVSCNCAAVRLSQPHRWGIL